MSYASSSQVQSEFKSMTFSSSTAVTSTEVTAYLADADAEINTRLCVKYSTPITGTEALLVMAMLEVWLVKHRILERIKVKTGKESTDQDPGSNYRKMALDLIDKLVAGTAKLSDATLATTADGVRSYSNDYSDPPLNVFDRTVDQW